MGKDEFRRGQRVGHGGMHCPCCDPGPSAKDRTALRRRARARLKAFDRRARARDED